jgi:SAM-dependent methyltransferase
LQNELPAVLCAYRQINLLTSLGDAELKISKKGTCTLLGGKALQAKLQGELPDPIRYDLPIDREKKHLLSGKEPFLSALGISDKNGRVHDKRQAKFRQINRFLEHLEAIYPSLPACGDLTVYDLCCGKSYLSFAVYYYLTTVKERTVSMTGVDLKRDVVEDCNRIAAACGFSCMQFLCGDVRTAVPSARPDMVISLHACDIATDIVLTNAAAWKTAVILSTPCCHHELNHSISCPELEFITKHSMLRQKLCDAATDALRLLRLEAQGYTTTTIELIDPNETPKNVMLRAIKRKNFDENSKEAIAAKESYLNAKKFLCGENSVSKFHF